MLEVLDSGPHTAADNMNLDIIHTPKKQTFDRKHIERPPCEHSSTINPNSPNCMTYNFLSKPTSQEKEMPSTI